MKCLLSFYHLALLLSFLFFLAKFKVTIQHLWSFARRVRRNFWRRARKGNLPQRGMVFKRGLKREGVRTLVPLCTPLLLGFTSLKVFYASSYQTYFCIRSKFWLQHEKDVENLTNKLDRERLRMKTQLEERLKKRRKEKIEVHDFF